MTHQPWVDGPGLEASLAAVGGRVVDRIESLHLAAVLLPEPGLAARLNALRVAPGVSRVERDRERDVQGAPDDPRYGEQWSLPRIRWDQVHPRGVDGEAVVAILDTGIDATHPDLAGRVLPGASFVDGADPWKDASGHGTAMAGIVAARTDDGSGIAGVGYAGVRILPVTVLGADGAGRDSDVIAGLVWAVEQRADVVLLAFSAPGYSSALQAAVDYAWEHDVVLVAAAGNDATDVPAFPAGDRGVIGVSATDADDRLDAASNRGEAVFLGAPGRGILSTRAGGGHGAITGTSAAAAHVAGAAALLRAFDPHISNGVVVARLARSAAPAGTRGETGNGRLDLARAVEDGSTEEVRPEGASPVGDGGPFVGPYVAAAAANHGDGTMAVSPTSVSAGSTGNTLQFTFTAVNDFNNGSIITLAVPSGWSSPQTSNAAGAGYVTLTNLSCENSPAPALSAAGSTITVTVSTSNSECKNGNQFRVTYANASAPSNAAQSTFTTTTRAGSSGTGVAIASSPVVAVVGPASQLALSIATTNLASGSTRVATATVQDSAGNTVSSGADATVVVTFSQPSGTGSVTGLGTATASGGVATLTVTGHKAGTVSLAASATASTGALAAGSGNPTSFSVIAGTFTKLQLLVPGETADPGSASGKTGTPTAQTSGSAFTVTVNAVDAAWNLVSSTNTIAITSSDANATLPANAALVAGTQTFSVTLKTAGSATVTASNVTTPSITANTSPSITVGAGAFTKLQLLVPGETASPGSTSGKTGTPTARTAGTSFSVTVNAVDANWNLVSSVTDTVSITSSDTAAVLPANAALVAGTRTFAVELRTAGTRTITATDVTDGTKTANTSPSITVNGGAAASFAVSAPATATSGTAITVTVTARDAYANTATSYTGTVTFTSTDSFAILPANTTFVSADAGVKSVSVTLRSPGTRTVTATDTVTSSITGTSGTVTVASSTVTKISVGAVTPSRTLTPSAGWIQGASGLSFTLDMTVIDPGTGDLAAREVLIKANGGGTRLGFDATGSSGSCISGCGGTSVTWGSVAVSGADFEQFKIYHNAVSLPVNSVHRFTVTLRQVPRETADVSDAITLRYDEGSATNTGDVAASNSPLKRYSLEITGVTPPATSIPQGSTLSPVVTIVNNTTASQLLTAADSSLSGTAFSSTGTEGGMPTITANGGSGTITYANATIIASTGSYTVEADAAKTTTVTAPHFSKTVTVTAAAVATRVVFTTSPHSLTAGMLSGTITVQLQDEYGNGANAPSGGTTVNLSTSSAGGTFRDTGDTTTISSVTIAQGTSSASFRYGDTVAGAPTLTAAVTGLTSGTQGQTVTAAAADRIVFTSSAQTLTAGTTSGTMTVELRDPYGNTATAGAGGVTVNLTTTSGGGAFRNTGDTSTITSVAIAQGASTASFRYRDTTSGTPTLTAAATGLTSATQGQTVNPAAANKLTFLQGPSNTTAAQTITPAVTVRVEDTYGNLITTSSASVTIAFGTNAGSGTLSGTLTRTASSGVATFDDLAVDRAASGYTLSVTSSGLTGATSSTFTISAGPATKLAFTSSAVTVTAGTTSASNLTVQLQDAGGNAVNAGAGGLLVSLSSSSAGATFRDTTDTSTITSVSIAQGASTASFRYRDTVAGTPTITAAASGYSSGTQQQTVNAAAATQLAFSTSPTTTAAGVASATITVEQRDPYGNASNQTGSALTVNLAEDSAGGSFRNTADSANITSVQIAVGASSASFKYRDTVAGTPTVTVSATGRTSATQQQTITPTTASKLAFGQAPTNVVAGVSISPAVTVLVQDTYGNTVTSSSASVSMAIGTNPGSSTLSGTTSRTATSGVASFNDLWLNKVATGYTLTATSTGLTAATSGTFNVTAGPASTFAFTPEFTTVGSQTAMNLTVTARDAYGNTATGYTGTVTFTSSDAYATLPANYTFLASENGVHAFANGVSFKTRGSQTITATDTLSASITGTSAAITVTADESIIAVGAPTPVNTSLSPTPGFYQGSSGNSLTIDVTIVDPGVGDTAAREVVLKMSSTILRGPFQASGSSGTCISNCGSGVTWGAATVAGGDFEQIKFVHSAGALPIGSVHRFTLALGTLARGTADGTDSFTAKYDEGSAPNTGDVAAASTLKRYSLQITSITPPTSPATGGATVSPVMTVVNRTSAAQLLTAAETSLSGTAFSSTGTEGAMPTIAANDGTGTVTYANAVITNSDGSRTVVGAAAKGTTVTAPSYSASVTVQAAPTAANDSYSVNEDASLGPSAPGVLGNDTDPQNDALTAVLVSSPANAASFTLNANGSFSFTPTANWNGTTTFTYRASDGTHQSAIATVTITVNSVNDAPVASAVSVTAGQGSTTNVLLTATDIDTATLTFSIVSGPSNGTLGAIGTPSCTTSGGTTTCTAIVGYTSNATYIGSDSFTYKANDGAADSNTATVSILVIESFFTSASGWSTSFSSSRYLKLTFPAYVPTGSIVSAASFRHAYRSRTSGDTTCWYFEVYSGASLLATHGSSGSPVSCNATTSFVTDIVALPEIDTVTEANNAVIRIYVRNSGGRQSEHDMTVLPITYALP